MALNQENNIKVMAASVNHQKINLFLVITFGFMVLLISAAVYLFILKESFGDFPIADLVPSEKSFHDLFNKKIKIAVLNSGYSYERNLTKSRILQEDIKLWEKFLRKFKFDYEILNDEIIEKEKHLQYSVIILPNSLFLTAVEADRLKKFIRAGGSLFAVGETQILLNNGTISERFFPPENFVLSNSEDSTQTDSLRLNYPYQISVFRGEIPLTSGIPAGYRMKISRENSIKAKLTHIENTNRLILSEVNKTSDDFYCTAANGINENGRYIWIGFSINAIRLGDDRIVFEKFLSNSINWLLGKPIASIKYNPAEYDAAAVIAPVLSDSIKNIYDVLKILANENIKASFFIDPKTSIENLALAANLDKYGEIGVYFKNLNINPKLIDTLRKSKRIIDLIAGDKSRGCTFFPGINIDQASEIAGKADFDYLLTEPSERNNPEYLLLPKSKKIAVFVSGLDSYSTADSGNQKFSAYKEDIDSILYLHGLYVFRFPIDNVYRIKALEKVIPYMKEKKFRITTFSEIQERFYEMQNLKISAEHKGRSRIFLHISNSGENNVNETAADVDLNEISPIAGIYIRPEFVSSKKIKTIDFNLKGILSLVFENLKPGESQSYFIDYNPGNI